MAQAYNYLTDRAISLEFLCILNCYRLNQSLRWLVFDLKVVLNVIVINNGAQC